MAVFMLQLADGADTLVEADAAGRTAAGEIVLERTDRHGRAERLRTYRAGMVAAIYRRSPADGGLYNWIPQPNDGTWWCY
ncbi:hypothetical protein AMK21_23160 [Streptomyces sp. CB00316]|uniref:hypothetical protein n=1 Tax=unclassified Streptomyces TaxID=2593676 RepID=UPI00093DAFAB|nr:hypothetical protein [Streptomyces sp. CB00316]OKJ17810.1 hypothetical protein AMK21_23160 [Streptomyces sp. CB00316]